MRNICIKTQGVHELPNELKPSKSPGPHEIHPRILKESATQVAAVLKLNISEVLTNLRTPGRLAGG